MAGVSPKTVSRVVNEDPAVNALTREQVLAVIRDTNYVPDHAARMMRTAVSSLVGLMTDEVATSPYAVDLVRGAQEALRGQGRTLLIANTEGDPFLEREYWRVFRAHKVAGVVFATSYQRMVKLEAQDFERPVVLANCLPAQADRAAIVPDDEGGGYAQAAHLLKLGHRRIGVLSLNKEIPATGLRAAGIRRAFQDAAAEFKPETERPAMVGPVETETLVAYAVALDLFARHDRPTAIICGNDKIALQVYAAAAAVGLSIPDDVSVIGFDDAVMIAESLHPQLTTVGLPYAEIGRRAVQILNRLEGCVDLLVGAPIRVACRLVERQSCRPLS